MNRPLFVHSNGQILDRLIKESNNVAMITTSMVQALQWITNPDMEISGVFLSPDDTSFSAFRFLEIALTHRPALPVFLFESTLNRNNENGQRVMKSTHIKGIFSGTEPFQTLISSLKTHLTTTDVVPRKVPQESIIAGYTALPISDFFTGTHYPYNIFIVADDGAIRLFAEKESSIDPTYLSKAAQRNRYLYVREDEVEESRTAIHTAKSNFLDNPDYPPGWKTAEVMVNARAVLNEMKQAGVNESLVEYTQAMLGDLFKLISKIESDEEGTLSSMIDKAQKCDRSVFCASYSMLICKQLRFEKTATLEILGLASVLQDIALYKTPYGDLSDKLSDELPPQQLAYYQQHPTQSADLVAHHTDVPQVTLQVIRQHHERKDKSGFPNRVGGTQLHPMAEILSLINSYYEVAKKHTSDAEVIITLNGKQWEQVELWLMSMKLMCGRLASM